MNVDLSPATHALLVGSSAAAVQIAIGELLAAVLDLSSSPLRAVGRWLIDRLPGPLVDVSLALLQRADKPVLLVSLLLLWMLASGAAATAGAAVALAVLAGLGLLFVLAMWRRVELPRASALAVGIGAAIAGPASFLLLPMPMAFVFAAGCVLAATIWTSARSGRGKQPAASLPQPAIALAPPSPGTELRIPGLSPILTPNSRFYVTDVAFPAPQVDHRTWQLEVVGLADRPLSLSFDDLLSAGSVEVDATLVCVHNPVGGHRVGTARWQGVPVSTLFRRAGVAPTADHVVARSVDGFSGGFPLALMESDEWKPIIAFAMNGRMLEPGHGAPARLLVPGIYGYDANVKWLKTLELTRFELARDYWEKKGWPRQPARVRCQSRIDVPRSAAALPPGRQVVAGVAWGPPKGVTRVEVSIDDEDWRACELADELAPTAWRQWRFDWDARAGAHRLRVRAWTADGVQEEQDAPPFPNGATGYHSVGVVVSPTGRRTGVMVLRVAADLNGRVSLARAGLKAWRSTRVERRAGRTS
jgi:DMSO/TMAO reductase YedYZ molybdopterin-dependent catalytic subunit